MVTLARAVLTDEEAGLVPPSEPEPKAELVADEDAEDRELAEALGMTLAEYRDAVSRNS